MTDTSLRLQILRYLKDNNGTDSSIDIKTPFIDLILEGNGRAEFKQTIENLDKDKFIELSDTGYGHDL